MPIKWFTNYHTDECTDIYIGRHLHIPYKLFNDLYSIDVNRFDQLPSTDSGITSLNNIGINNKEQLHIVWNFIQRIECATKAAQFIWDAPLDNQADLSENFDKFISNKIFEYETNCDKKMQ